MPKYIFVFAQAHHEFRIPELNSVAEVHGFTFTLPANADDRDIARPYMVLTLDEEEDALALARRCVLVKAVYEFYAQGDTYEELHVRNQNNRALWEHFIPKTSFKFTVTAYNHKIPDARQREVIESFAYMDFLGKIDMKNPEVVLGCFEECKYDLGECDTEEYDLPCTDHDRSRTTRTKHDGDGEFRQLYFGRLLEEGSARYLIGMFDVKKRVYFGNTSMEAEMSLLMINQSLAAPGKLIYDPFVGTGSMAYPAAHFGAFVYGSDIDGRQMRGKETTPGVYRAAQQYGIATRIIDLCTFDITRNPWRIGNLFDAIVTDPPYGVRAGAKRIGRKKELSKEQFALYMEHRNAPPADDQPYFPPTKPYELSNLVVDLVLLARYLLKPGGRLVFFLPTVNEDYQEVDISSMLCRGMELVAISLQNFGSWGRRLVTIRKTTNEQHEEPNFDVETHMTHIPAHKDFREKYFQGFKKENHLPHSMSSRKQMESC